MEKYPHFQVKKKTKKKPPSFIMQVPISLIYLKSNVEDVQFLLQSSK